MNPTAIIRITHHVGGRAPFVVTTVVPEHPPVVEGTRATLKRARLLAASVSEGYMSRNGITATIEEVGCPTPRRRAAQGATSAHNVGVMSKWSSEDLAALDATRGSLARGTAVRELALEALAARKAATP